MQFCELRESGTLLERSLQRVVCVVPPERICALVTRQHPPISGKLRNEMGRLIVQPENRGTAAAVLYGVLAIHGRNPLANIAIFRADHYFSNEIAFMMRVRSAFRLVERRPDLIVVLGIVPDYPAMNRGWIEPGDPVPYASEAPSFRIRRFWERPLMHRAEALMARGCLWNSQVVVGSADALLLLIQQCAPFLYQAFAPARPMLGTVKERDAVEGVYANLLKTDFSTEVMAVAPQVLAVMAVERNGQSEVTDHGRTVPLMAPNRQWRGAGG